MHFTWHMTYLCRYVICIDISVKSTNTIFFLGDKYYKKKGYVKEVVQDFIGIQCIWYWLLFTFFNFRGNHILIHIVIILSTHMYCAQSIDICCNFLMNNCSLLLGIIWLKNSVLGLVVLNDTGAVLKVDQEHLETVVPQVICIYFFIYLLTLFFICFIIIFEASIVKKDIEMWGYTAEQMYACMLVIVK